MAEQEQPRVFHHLGWRFVRYPTGSVEINTGPTDRLPAGEGLVLTPEAWASIVASMGEGGETHDNWRAALAFHQDAHSHGEPTHLRAARQQVILALDAYLAARSYWIDLPDAQDRSFAAGVATHRAWLELHDAEARLIAQRATLAALAARHEASRAQPPAQAQVGGDQGDPGDEQPRVGAETASRAAHRLLEAFTQTVTASNATPGAAVAPAASVAATADPRAPLLTQPNVTGIAPASLHRLASLAAGDGDLAGLQGWFSHHAAAFTMSYGHAEQEWRAQASVALHGYSATGSALLSALRRLARQVLARHGQPTPGEAL